MSGSGEEQREAFRPEFNRSIMIDFQAKIISDTGFLLLREIDERFGMLGPLGSELEDTMSWVHSKHTQLETARQRVYQIAAGYEDCNDWAILPYGRRSQTLSGVAYQASDQGWSEGRVSWSEVVCSCRVGVSFGPTLPVCVRVTRAAE